MHVWRMSLQENEKCYISWAGSYVLPWSAQHLWREKGKKSSLTYLLHLHLHGKGLNGLGETGVNWLKIDFLGKTFVLRISCSKFYV